MLNRTPRLTLVDLFCGRGGWTRAAIRRGWKCVGFDIEDHGYPGILVQQQLPCDTQLIRQFNPALVVASPPCEDYARRGLPWMRHAGPIDERPLRWAVSLADRLDCPVVVECSQFAARHLGGWRRCGSFYLWGDVPALLPSFKHDKHSNAGNKEDGTAVRAAKKAMIPEQLAGWIIDTYTPARVHERRDS
jgi:hypothetical protein